MDFSIPQNCLWMIPMLYFFVAFIKDVSIIEKYKKFLPVLCVLLGATGAWYMGIKFPDFLTTGLAIGLVTTGGHEALGQFIEDSKKASSSNLIAGGINEKTNS